MELVGILFLAFICFIVFGLLGHILDFLGCIIGWIADGCFSSIGCLFWVAIIILFLMSLV